MTDKSLTGYPSIDKPWLKYYKEGAEEAALNIPANKTVWDVIEEKLLEYKEIPAIEYFGRVISRPEFIDMVYTWARAFKALGVKEDEVIPYYGPFFPDVGAMAFALNIIGACPYFLKLAITPDALAEETKNSRFAIVFDEMWENVSGEFSKDKYKKILIMTAADGMASPKRQIVSLLGKLKHGTSKIPGIGKYIRIAQAKRFADRFNGEVKAPFVENRGAFITSSSGTTVDGVVKGTVATNESTISQLYMGASSDIQYFPGEKCLNHFPPTASTSLNVLFFLALYKGMTVVMDPRVTEDDFYYQIIHFKPNVVLTTGSAWDSFFTRVIREIHLGKRFDFTCAKGWVIGGEGIGKTKYERWNQIIANSGGVPLFSGYGSSELFSATAVEKVDARYDFSKSIMSVGIPYAGINMGVFDDTAHELGYNQRGELWIKSRSAMKEYYNKPDLTAKTLVDGWIHTGDLAEIDENGFVYIWGRVSDHIKLSDGKRIFLFDIANKIMEQEFIDDAIVLPFPGQNTPVRVAAHIVWNGHFSEADKAEYLTELNRIMKSYLPEEISLYVYAEHEGMLPYSPTTLKKDKNKMSRQTTGFVQVADGKLISLSLEKIQEVR